MKPPVYVVKPRNIFKHPFNKYDLDKPTTRETQNQELTDYFNYGFNEDTMNIYAKLVKRTIETLDTTINPNYNPTESNLTRLNDQIPMDFGGFCNFYDVGLLKNDLNQSFYMGDSLVEYFIYLLLMKKTKPEQNPLIQFVKKMYPDSNGQSDALCQIMDKISDNLQRQYQQMLKRLYALKIPEKKAPTTKPQKKVSSKKVSTQSQDQSQSQEKEKRAKKSHKSHKKKTHKKKSKNSRSRSRSRSKDKKIKKDKDKRRKKSKSKSKHKKHK